MTTTATLAALRREIGYGQPTLPKLFGVADRASRLDRDSGAPRQRIAVIGSFTTSLLAKAVACAAVQEGMQPELYEGLYGAWRQEALNPASGLTAFGPDLVCICVDARELLEDLPLGADAAAVGDRLDAQTRDFAAVWAALCAGRKVEIIQDLLVPPAATLTGLAERRAPAGVAAFVAALNDRLIAAAGSRVAWIETDRLACEIGLNRWFGRRHYYLSKQPFDPKFLPDYAMMFRRAWRSAFARAKKVLVLDLDNTLWGGVVGDDGVGGLILGPDTPAGEAFADWGRHVKALSRRGVILAVCSKNDPEIAAAAFQHPHMALSLSDIACFHCSWEDKVEGLRRIAETLNLGVDSFVFADDNPAECALVRERLPEVAVVELGDDPTTFIDRLETGRWFGAESYSPEDFRRATAYAARSRAAAAAENVDLASHLESLAMVGRLTPATVDDLPRLAQMEQKTNQFNLTTRRYTSEQIRALIDRGDARVVAFRLADRFGDHGLVASLIAIREGDDLRIDNWLMSCRVFSRSAEAFILRRLAEWAATQGVARLTGEYLPTAKNGVVKALYARLGFRPMAGDPPGRLWERPIGPDSTLDDLASPIRPGGAG